MSGINSRREVYEALRGGFGHIAVHPNGRWLYVSLEPTKRLALIDLEAARFGSSPGSERFTLSRPPASGEHQAAAIALIHPNGRYLYVVNQSDSPSGQNSLAAFTIDRTTGVLALVHRADIQSMLDPTFTIDSTGRNILAAHRVDRTVVDRVSTGWVISKIGLGLDGQFGSARSQSLPVTDDRVSWIGTPAKVYHPR